MVEDANPITPSHLVQLSVMAAHGQVCLPCLFCHVLVCVAVLAQTSVWTGSGFFARKWLLCAVSCKSGDLLCIQEGFQCLTITLLHCQHVLMVSLAFVLLCARRSRSLRSCGRWQRSCGRICFRVAIYSLPLCCFLWSLWCYLFCFLWGLSASCWASGEYLKGTCKRVD